MIDRATRLRVRRKFKRRRSQVEGMGVHADEHLEQHLFKRLSRLFDVRRFVLGWILFLVLLVSGVTLQLRALGAYYQQLAPVAGGTYTEGMIGNFTNANPMYANGLVDASVSRLVFSGLLKYDANNQLVGDLAQSWNVDAKGEVYTVVLRPNLKWHDGVDLTAEDVVFTFKTIQNPDAKSPLFNAWRGIDVQAVDAKTVTFTLSNSLAPFVYGLTTGIVPKHKLQDIDPAQLRSAPFNTSNPVGAGPFAWDAIEVIANGTQPSVQNIGLKAFDAYYAGRPKLDRFILKTYVDEAQLVTGFRNQEINSLVGLNNLPESLSGQNDIKELSTPLTAETAVFLRTDSELLKDARVRQALVQSVDIPAVVGSLGYPVVVADEPLLHSQLGYNGANRQLPSDVEQAKKLLDEAGWHLAPNETVRTKGQAKLSLKFFAANNADYIKLTQRIQQAWQAVGVEAQATLPSDGDLQTVVNNRDYDALLYGISIGVDPDVFAYWHSSQADPRAPSRLNFSNYRSTAADKALEAGRSRSDASLRAAKYQPFLQAWRSDAPALVLYQPRFLYITRGQLFGFDSKAVNTATDRFNNVENWMIRQGYVLKP